jgi:deoxyadenosine/deoxycytidine kinase
MQIEHLECEAETLKMRLASRKRDLEFKIGEREHMVADLETEE